MKNILAIWSHCKVRIKSRWQEQSEKEFLPKKNDFSCPQKYFKLGSNKIGNNVSSFPYFNNGKLARFPLLKDNLVLNNDVTYSVLPIFFHSVKALSFKALIDWFVVIKIFTNIQSNIFTIFIQLACHLGGKRDH